MLRLLIRRPSVLPSADADVGVDGEDDPFASSNLAGDVTLSDTDSTESTDGLESASDWDCEVARERSEVLRGRACALHGFIPRNPACACGLQKVRNLVYLLLGSFDFVSLKRERR